MTKIKKVVEQMVQIAVAILRNAQGEILLGKRRQSQNDSCAGLWEFPGGKVETGESIKQCLVRECQEELQVIVEMTELYDVVQHVYPERMVEVQFWTGYIVSGTPQAVVHDELRWVAPEALATLESCPANASIIERLMVENKGEDDHGYRDTI